MASSHKFYCPACDVVRKGPSGAHFCGQPMTDMGTRWRPGRKGHRAARDDRIRRRAHAGKSWQRLLYRSGAIW
jgi:hypothetical protein